jgi:hypothetical protein
MSGRSSGRTGRAPSDAECDYAGFSGFFMEMTLSQRKSLKIMMSVAGIEPAAPACVKGEKPYLYDQD